MRKKFPYRKWRVGNREFCGTFYSQDPSTFEIMYQQPEYAKHLRPINLTKDRTRDKEAHATDKEVAALRAINGAANWLASQTPPDLCVQTSLSQQCFPKPKVKDLLFANQLVHRVRQYHEVASWVSLIMNLKIINPVNGPPFVGNLISYLAWFHQPWAPKLRASQLPAH